MFNTKEAAAIYGVSHETIRNWSEEFTSFLSQLANPGKGRNRSFSEADMTVLSLIAEMKQHGNTYDEIRISLDRGDRGKPPDISPSQVQSLLTTENEKKLMLQLENMQREITRAYQERDKALEQAQKAHELEIEIARLQATIEGLKQQLQKERETGRLEGELEALRRQMKQGE